jgi:hypothetical protein
MGIFKTLPLLFLAGCSLCPATAPPLLSACPVAPAYSQQFEESAAKQLSTIPDNSPISTMLGDYGKVRAEIRDCQK